MSRLTNKHLTLLSWLPIAHLAVLPIFFFRTADQGRGKLFLMALLKWFGIYMGCFAIRAVVTILCQAEELDWFVDVVTYGTLYLAFALGALLCVHDLKKVPTGDAGPSEKE